MRFWQWGGAPPDAVHPSAARQDGQTGYNTELKSQLEAVLAGEFPEGLAQSYFLGNWCVEGHTDLHGAVVHGGDFLTLDNGQGSTSTGEFMGPFLWLHQRGIPQAVHSRAIAARLTGRTYWARCNPHLWTCRSICRGDGLHRLEAVPFSSKVTGCN